MKKSIHRVGYFVWARILVLLGIMLMVVGACTFFIDFDGPGSTLVTPPVIITLAPAVPATFQVTGYLVAWTTEPNVVVDAVFVPGVKVWLTALLTGIDTEIIRTDLSGRFSFGGLSSGSYELCWEADGFDSGCGQRIITIVDESLNLGTIGMSIRSSVDFVHVYGSVTLADDSLPRAIEPFANVNAFATVTAVDAAGNPLAAPAYVNNFGKYIIPNAPKDAIIHANIENISESVLLSSVSPNNANYAVLDIQLKNNPPKMEEVFALDLSGGTTNHWTFAPGAKVELRTRASDRDGDPLEYRWIMPDGAGTLSSDFGAAVTWQLPAELAEYQVEVIAYDSKGGYVKEGITVSTLGTVRFSGRVDATDTPAVVDATIDINGNFTTTNADGFFYLEVDENPRYVLNIRKQGYGLVSVILDGSTTDGLYTLTRAFVATVDPSGDIEVTEERPPENCRGSLSSRVDWESIQQEFPRLFEPQVQDGQGNLAERQQIPDDVILPFQQQERRECGPGLTVQIPANSLVDSSGNPPPGLVDIELTTFDLQAPNGMPGDYVSIALDSSVNVMQSYGAGFINITDGSGTEYNLAPGAEAVVIIPIDPAQLAAGGALSATIPIFYYDEQQGLWLEEADLVGDLDGDRYVVRARHFSSINADVQFVDQACVRVDSIIMPPSFDLEVTIPRPGAAPTVITQNIDNSSRRFHVIYRLPTNTNITLQAYTTGTTTSILPASAPIVVNTGAAQFPTTPFLPEFPYAACKASVELVNPRIPDAPISAYLHGVFSFSATNLDADETNPANPADAALVGDLDNSTNSYYVAIDPHRLRETLTEFISENNFNPATEIVGIYANAADLGFGREMHCTRNGSAGNVDVACYVTNFGNRFSPDNTDFLLAALHKLGINVPPVATVAMEYTRLEDPADPNVSIGNRFVKFYVFNGAGNRVNKADLDGNGNRPIPQLCIVCHGGDMPNSTNPIQPFTASNVNLGSQFLPFDLSGFVIIDGALDPGTFPGAANFNKAAQQDDFRRLNEEIVAATVPDPNHAIRDLITALYAGLPAGDNTQNVNFAVPGWQSPVSGVDAPGTYSGVVGPSCRTCHISQEPALSWQTAAGFSARGGSTDFRVCSQHVMPHAIVTYSRFWLSVGPHQPRVLHDFLNGAAAVGSGAGAACVNP